MKISAFLERYLKKKPNPEVSGLFGFCGTSSLEASGEPGTHGLFFG